MRSRPTFHAPVSEITLPTKLITFIIPTPATACLAARGGIVAHVTTARTSALSFITRYVFTLGGTVRSTECTIEASCALTCTVTVGSLAIARLAVKVTAGRTVIAPVTANARPYTRSVILLTSHVCTQVTAAYVTVVSVEIIVSAQPNTSARGLATKPRRTVRTLELAEESPATRRTLHTLSVILATRLVLTCTGTNVLTLATMGTDHGIGK